MRGPDIHRYLEQLEQLPFIDSATLSKEAAKRGHDAADARIELDTPAGKRKLRVELKKSHLSYEIAERVIHRLGKEPAKWILMAPKVGAPMGEHLATQGINYVDLQGNCHLRLGDRYIAIISGRQPTSKGARTKGLRTPGYQVLFALLAKPELMHAPLRELAQAAGVSRQPAADVRRWLADSGLATRRGRHFSWIDTKKREALDRWLNGYVTTVRPTLLIGTYRTQDKTEAARRKRITPILRDTCPWRWGGETAGHLLNRYYRGTRTVVHVQQPPHDLAVRLRAIPARGGELVILHSPGPIGMEGIQADTVHPLLIYSEMMATDDERIRESAHELLTKFTDLT